MGQGPHCPWKWSLRCFLLVVWANHSVFLGHDILSCNLILCRDLLALKAMWPLWVVFKGFTFGLVAEFKSRFFNIKHIQHWSGYISFLSCGYWDFTHRVLIRWINTFKNSVWECLALIIHEGCSRVWPYTRLLSFLFVNFHVITKEWVSIWIL